MMTKWDTIQADVADMYLPQDEQDFYDEQDADPFGFAKAIELDHLTDEQLDQIADMFGDN